MGADRQAENRQGEEGGAKAIARPLHDADRTAPAYSQGVRRKIPHTSARISLLLRRILIEHTILANRTKDIQDETCLTDPYPV